MPWVEASTQGLEQVCYSSYPELTCLGTLKLPMISQRPLQALRLPSQPPPSLEAGGACRTAQQLQVAAVRETTSLLWILQSTSPD